MACRTPARPSSAVTVVCGQDFDVRPRGDALDQIARHARIDAGAANDQPDPGDLAGQIHRRLARGIARADQRHVLARAQPSLQRRGPVVDAGALEGRETLDIETAITGAAGDNDCAGGDALLVGQGEQEASAVRVDLVLQARGFVRNFHFDAELLRLRVGAGHQRHAGDAGRKAQIVLDAGRRTGLPAKRATVQHQRRQALGPGIHGGREPRRPGADDRHVVDPVRIDRCHKADAAGQRHVAGIAQHLSARAEHDRQFAGLDGKTLDQRSRARIVPGVEPLMRMPVAGQEAFEPQNVAVIRVADDHRSAGAGLEQADTAQDQGAHDPLTKFGLLHHEVAQPAGSNDGCLDCRRGGRVHQGRAPRQLREFAHQ